MKKNIFTILSTLTVCVLLGIGLLGCSSSSDKISSCQITRLCNKHLKDNALNQEYTQIAIGYFETTAEERCVLKKLEAAGIVSVKFERFAWWEKSFVTKKVPRTYYDWWGYAYKEYVTQKVEDYSFEDHIMANVTLTPAGEKLLVKDLPEAKEKKDKDMKQPEFDASKYPEYSVDCSENWPKIKNPFIKEKEKETEKTDNKEVKPTKDNKKTETKENDKTQRIDSLQYAAYQQALDRTNKTICSLKGCTIKAKKARNIQIINENGINTAIAEVIFEQSNVSDAYRVINGSIDGTKATQMVMLTYYIDKGWVLTENPQTEFAEKYLKKWIEGIISGIEEVVDTEAIDE